MVQLVARLAILDVKIPAMPIVVVDALWVAVLNAEEDAVLIVTGHQDALLLA